MIIIDCYCVLERINGILRLRLKREVSIGQVDGEAFLRSVIGTES